MAENDERRPGSSGRDALEDETLDYGVGKSSAREELETDGPVMGGPGMVRTGADRAVSTGTGGLAAGEDSIPWRRATTGGRTSAAVRTTRRRRSTRTTEPSYRYGWERAGQSEYRNRGFEEVDLDLRRDWESSSGQGLPDWEQAREPARGAFDRARGRKSAGRDNVDEDDSKR